MICSLSLDLDNKWTYMRTHGDSGWASYPSYLDIVIPRVLDLLERHDLKITFFIVGRDAELERNREALSRITAEGHEVGNHSYDHEPWFHRFDRDKVVNEIARAEELIERVTGRRPFGYRAPGYSLTRATLEVLAERGYTFDGSTFPTFIGPLARAYYFMTADLDDAQKADRAELFGGMREGLRPLDPYAWSVAGGDIVEIPVTTLPIMRIPIHPSYVHYLAARSPLLARTYFAAAMDVCRMTRTEPSVLLHPLDFLGAEDAPELAFFPAMGCGAEHKMELMDALLGSLTRRFQVVPMSEHASALAARGLRRRSYDKGEDA